METHIIKGRSTVDGAGVRLFRVFAHDHAVRTDPFLLFDHFGSDDPDDYVRGFPWHPHRGIETVTYMLDGEVAHGDSLGNTGVIRPGDLQWMTAGSGIIHQEMPQPRVGMLQGMQLWVNLPAAHKMMGPRYRGIEQSSVPVVHAAGADVRVIAGTYEGTQGPVKDLMVDISYVDVTVQPGAAVTLPVRRGYTAFCYLITGAAAVGTHDIVARQMALLQGATSVTVRARDATRFMFAAGCPLREPIAWGGPIVMNTQKELDRAFQELDEGTFVKKTHIQETI